MIIGVLTVEFHLPGSQSLKQKRMVISRVKGRLRSRYNVSVAEVDYQDKWQRGVLAVATVVSDRRVAEGMLGKITKELEAGLLDGTIMRTQLDFVE